MKSKILFISALTLGLTAVLAGGMTPNGARGASAYSHSDGYTASGDHFIVSFHGSKISNQYGSNKADQVLNSGSYVLDVTSSIQWKVSYGKNSSDTFAGLKLGNDGGHTIKDDADDNFKDLYDKMSELNSYGETTHYVNAIYSTTAISSVTDLSVSWGAAKGDFNENVGKLYLFYKLTTDGAEWTPIYRNGDTKYHYTPSSAYQGSGTTSAWDWRKACPTTTKIEESGLYGQNAQIAIVHDGGETSNKCNITLYTLMVNRVNSIKSVMNYLDNPGCGTEACNALTIDKNKYRVMFDMALQNIEQGQIDALNVAADFGGGRCKEATYYAQFAYFCDVAGYTLTLTPTPAAVNRVLFSNKSSYGLIVVIASATVASIGLVLLLAKKKKHN